MPPARRSRTILAMRNGLLVMLLVAVAALAMPLGLTPVALAAPSAELLRPEITCLSSNVATVRFAWTPGAGAGQQWIDLSTTDNGWRAGSFDSAGPLEATASSYTWQGVKTGSVHFWRLNSLTPDGWAPSSNGAFIPCPAVAATGSVNFSFGAGVPEADQATVRNSIDSLRAYSLANLGADSGRMNVYAYDDLQELSEAMATWLGSPGYILQFRNLWLNSSVAAVTYHESSKGDAFFIWSGGPVWAKTTSGDLYRVVAHEYFHVVQRQLSSPHERGPTWLVEGSAEAFSWQAYLYKQGLPADTVREALTNDARPYGGTLKTLEEGGVFNANGYAVYALGVLATDYAVKTRGLRAVAGYYKLVGEGLAWRDAFARTFGTTLEYFYDQFEAYRANGFR